MDEVALLVLRILVVALWMLPVVGLLWALSRK